MIISLELPWPPTANTYWRRNGNRYFISKKGLDYRNLVCKACLIYQDLFKIHDRIKVIIKAYPPDKRKRDLDNLFKSLLDSIQSASVYDDDSQIDNLSIERMPEYDGKVIVMIEKI